MNWIMERKLESWLITIGTLFLTWLALELVYKFVWRLLERWAAKTAVLWDDELLAVTKRPTQLMIFVASVFIALKTGLIQEPSAHATANLIFKILSVVCGIWLLERVAGVLIVTGSVRVLPNRGTRSLLLTVTRILIFSIGGLLILDNVGISITPILASLGVGSVAVALALQDTLSNFFSGVYLLIDQPIRVGDWIKTETDTEGRVTRIGWRSTQIHLRSNNIVVFPNSRLAASKLTNYNMPELETTISMDIGVAYESDLQKVEAVTIAVAREVMARVEGGIANSEPGFRFHTFGDSSITLTVTLNSRTFPDSFLIKHEFIKAIVNRYREEGIELPFPQRVVRVQREELHAPAPPPII